MAESKVQFTTKADVSGLKAWTATIIDAARALDKMTDAQKRNEDATDGGASGGTTPTPSPVSPVAPMPDGGGGGASPPPGVPPSPSPTTPGGWSPSWHTPVPWFTPPSVPPAPGGGPPPPSPPGGGQPPNPPNPSPGGGGTPTQPPGNAFSTRVGHGLSTGLGMGVGMALGGSALGFIMSAGEEFMEVDRILGQLDQRFGDAQGIRQFGAQLGYTVEQAASLATILGAVEGSFSSRVASRYTGFARVSGLDPQQTVGQLAVIGRMGGSPLSNEAMSALAGGAVRVGMATRNKSGEISGGRLNEYLDVVGAMMAQQQQATGSADVTTQQRTLELISRAFGGRDVGTGRNALDIAGRLQGVMTGGGLTPFLMRTMGYGRDPNIGYVDMRKRIEAGINDPQNLASLFETFSARGYSKDQMFRALESVSGGQLRATEIEALVGQLGSAEGRQAYLAGGAQTGSGIDYAAAGAGTVRTGEARAVQLQGMKLDVGDTVAQMMGDLTDAAQNLMKASENLFGGGLGDAATGLSGAIVTATGAIKTATDLIDSIWRWWKNEDKEKESPELTPEQRRIDAESAPKPGQRPPAGANFR